MEETSSKDSGTIYEIGFHISPFVGEEKVADEVSVVRSFLDKIKAEVISEDFPRLRALAYPLSKVLGGSKKNFKEAYFGWVKFEAESKDIAFVKTEIEKMENVLRFLIIKTVRENTLQGNKFFARTDGNKARKDTVTIKPEEKGPIDEGSIDKTIEDLVIS